MQSPGLYTLMEAAGGSISRLVSRCSSNAHPDTQGSRTLGLGALGRDEDYSKMTPSSRTFRVMRDCARI